MATKQYTDNIINSFYSQIKKDIEYFYNIIEDIEDALYVKLDLENKNKDELLSENEFKALIWRK